MKVNIEDGYDLAIEIMDYILDDHNVALIADYEVIYEALRNLLMLDDPHLELASLEFGNGSNDGYCGPYLMEIGNGEIWCQKAYSDKGKIFIYDGDIVFAEHAYINEAKAARPGEDVEFFELYFGEKCDNEEDYDGKLHLIFDENKVPCGFEYNREDDESCFHLKYCECNPTNIGDIIEMYNDISNSMGKWFY